MTTFPTPYDAICDDMRRRRSPDGALVGIFLNAERHIVLTTEISEGTRHVDELFLRHLVTVVADIGVPDVVFAVARATGRPARIDRLLWRELLERLDDGSTGLLDLMVVGESRWWSAASGR
jgi:DNA repair protein RadC